MPEVQYNDANDIDKFILTIGRVVRAWADLEGSLWLFVSQLLRVVQYRARIVMNSISNGRAQRELVKVLAETYLEPELLPEFRGYLKRMKTLGDQRNLLAHATFHINPDSRENLAFRDTFGFGEYGGLAFSAPPFPLNQAKVLLTAIKKLNHQLILYVVKTDGNVLSSARTHREPSPDPT